MALDVLGAPLSFEVQINTDGGASVVQVDNAVKDLIVNLTKLGIGGAQIDSLIVKFGELMKQQSGIKDSLSKATNPVDIQKYNQMLTETNASMKGITEQMAALAPAADQVNQTVQKTVGTFAQLRRLKNEISALNIQQGINPNDQTGSQLTLKIQEASILEHALENTKKELNLATSNVAGLQAAGTAVRGLIGGFQAYAGVMGIFGASEEKATEATRAVINLMGILNGMQEVGALLSKHGQLNIYLETLLRGANARSISAETDALLKNKAVRVAGSAGGALTVLPGVIGQATIESAKAATELATSSANTVDSTSQLVNNAVTKEATLISEQSKTASLGAAAAKGVLTTQTALNTGADVASTLANEGNVAAKEGNILATGALAAASDVQTASAVTATVATEGLSAAISLSPIGLILVSLVALAGAYEVYKHSIGEATDSEERAKNSRDALNETTLKAQETISKETGSIEVLLIQAENLAASYGKRQLAIDELRSKYPEYLSQLSQENILTSQGSELIQKQTQLLRAKALVSAGEDLYKEKLTAQLKIQAQITALQEGGDLTAGQKLRSFFQTFTTAGGLATKDAREVLIKNLSSDLEEATQKTEAFNSQLISSSTSLANLYKDPTKQIEILINTLDRATNRLPGVIGVFDKLRESTLKAQLAPPQDPAVFAAQTDVLLAPYKLAAAKALAGSQAQANAQRALNEATHKRELEDRSKYYADGTVMDGAAGVKALADQGAYLNTLNSLNDSDRAKALKSRAAFAAATVAQLESENKQTSDSYYNAKIASIRATAAEQVNQERSSSGSIRKINEEAFIAIRNFSSEFQKTRLEAEAVGIQTRLNLVRQGSLEEYSLKLLLIENHTKQDLSSAAMTEAQKLQIVTKGIKDRQLLDRQYQDSKKQSEVSAEASLLQIRLNEAHQVLSISEAAPSALKVQISNTDGQEALAANQAILDNKAKQELLAAQKSHDELSIKNKEAGLKTTNEDQEFSNKSLEIYSNLNRDKLKLTQDFYDKQRALAFTSIDETTAKLNRAPAAILSDPFAGLQAQAEAQKQILENNLNAAKEKFDRADKDQRAAILVSQNLSDKVKQDVLGSRGSIEQLHSDVFKSQSDLEAAKNAVKIYTEQIQIIALKNMSSTVATIAGAFTSLSSVISGLDKDIGETTKLIGTIGTSLSGAFKGVADFKKASQELQNAKTGSDQFAALGAELTSVIGIAMAALQVIEAVISLAKQGHATNLAARREIEARQAVELLGEITINDEYRTRLILQAQLNTLKIPGLTAVGDALKANKASILSDYKSIFAELEKQSFISGQHLTKYGGDLIGLFRKTKVTDELSSLAGKSFDEIQKLFDTGKLTDKAKVLFQELQKLKQEGIDVDAALAQNKKDLQETFTGTTSDSLLQSIADGFSQGKHSAKDFAQNFQDLMKAAILNALKYQTLQVPLQAFYDKFSEFSQSGGVLTADEIDQLQRQYNNIITTANAQFEQLSKVTKVDFNNSSGQSLTGAIAGITAQQADVLAGQFGGLRLTAFDQLSTAKSSLLVLNEIANNTAILKDVLAYYRKWDLSGILTKF